MPGKSILAAVAVGGWLMASVLAFLLVAHTGFLGIGLVGLFLAFASSQVELESDGRVGGAYGATLIQHQAKAERELTGEQRVAAREAQSVAVQSVRFFKHFGIGLAIIGLGGFAYYNL